MSSNNFHYCLFISSPIKNELRCEQRLGESRNDGPWKPRKSSLFINFRYRFLDSEMKILIEFQNISSSIFPRTCGPCVVGEIQKWQIMCLLVWYDFSKVLRIHAPLKVWWIDVMFYWRWADGEIFWGKVWREFSKIWSFWWLLSSRNFNWFQRFNQSLLSSSGTSWKISLLKKATFLIEIPFYIKLKKPRNSPIHS